MVGAWQSARQTCAACGEPLKRCLRVIGMPASDSPMWMCEVCWHPKDELERAEYRRLYGIPPVPAFQCCLCGRPAPIEALVAAYLLQDHVRDEAGRGSKLSALSTYGPRFLRTIPPRGARDGAGLISLPSAVQCERRA